MRIRALQTLVSGPVTHSAGSVFEIDDYTGSMLIGSGKAEQEGGKSPLANVTSFFAQVERPGHLPPQEPKKEAAAAAPAAATAQTHQPPTKRLQPMTTENSGLVDKPGIIPSKG